MPTLAYPDGRGSTSNGKFGFCVCVCTRIHMIKWWFVLTAENWSSLSLLTEVGLGATLLSGHGVSTIKYWLQCLQLGNKFQE